MTLKDFYGPAHHKKILMIEAALTNAGLLNINSTIVADAPHRAIMIDGRAVPSHFFTQGSPESIVKYMKDQELIARERAAETKCVVQAKPIGGLSADLIVVDEPVSTRDGGTIGHYPIKNPYPIDEQAVYGAFTVNEYGQPRVGDWIQTYTGIKFHPLDIKPDDIDLYDIAHALSLVNRLTGHTFAAYSVAEHSVRRMWAVRDLVGDLDENESTTNLNNYEKYRLLVMFEALMHDASEAYLADIARPIKMLPIMAGYREIEDIVEKAIRGKYRIAHPMTPVVKRADEVLLRTEARDLMVTPPADWIFREEPLKEKIKPWSADLAEFRFIEAFYDLCEKLGIEG